MMMIAMHDFNMFEYLHLTMPQKSWQHKACFNSIVFVLGDNQVKNRADASYCTVPGYQLFGLPSNAMLV